MSSKKWPHMGVRYFPIKLSFAHCGDFVCVKKNMCCFKVNFCWTSTDFFLQTSISFCYTKRETKLKDLTIPSMVVSKCEFLK